RPQAKIDAKERPFRSGCGKALQNFFGQPIEKLVIGKLRRELPLFVVNENKIDIGTVVQLAATKFAEGKDRKLALRRAELLSQLNVPVIEYAADTDFGNLRKLGGGFFEVGGIRNLARGDPDHFA